MAVNSCKMIMQRLLAVSFPKLIQVQMLNQKPLRITEVKKSGLHLST